MRAIYKRELKSYMTSMIGCVFLTFFLVLGGLYFFVYNLMSGYTYFAYAIYSTTFFLMIGVPILTMKSFAEDKKNKTEQLLMTSPASLTKIVMGKYLAMVTIFAIPCVFFCVCPVIIQSYGESYFIIDYSTILAYFLLGCVFISVGMYLSSITESQVIAAISTFGALFVLYMWESLVAFLPWTTLQTYLTELSLMSILDNFVFYKLFDITGLIVYLSVAGVFVFLTIQTLQKRRWS